MRDNDDHSGRQLPDEMLQHPLAGSLFTSFFDHLSDGVVEVGPDFTCRFINRAAEAMLHLDRKIIVGKNLLDALPVTMGSELSRHARMAGRQGDGIEFEIFCGALETWFTCLCYPLKERMVLLFKDITTRRKAEAESDSGSLSAMLQKEILGKIFDHIPVMLCFYDQEIKIKLINAEFERVLGWSLEEARQIDLMAACYPDPDYRLKVRQFMMSAAPGWQDFIVCNRYGDEIETSWANVRLSDGSQIGIGIDIRARKTAEAKLRLSEERYRQLSRKTLELLEKERMAITGELHDSIGTSLAAIKFSLESRIQQMPQDYRIDGQITFEKIVDYLQDAIRESKRISARLRPKILDEKGLLSTIEWFARSYAELYPGIKLVRAIYLREEDIPPDYKVVLYRVIQEALNNAAKHSGATVIRLNLTRTDSHIHMIIQDNGCGFDPGQLTRSADGLSGFGLHSMQERVEICNGTCFLTSGGSGAGTRIDVKLPLDPIDPNSSNRSGPDQK